MAEDIYICYNIDKNKLKRDYCKNPLLKISRDNGHGGLVYEKPYKEDLEYLYINKNMRLMDLCKLFIIDREVIKRWIKYYNIKKSKNLIIELQKQTNICKYGFTNPTMNKDIQEKIKFTNRKKLGVDYPMQSEEIRIKSRKTNLSKLNVEYPSKSKKCLEKMFKTKKDRGQFINISKEEELAYNLLKYKFNNVERQWRKEDYPGLADFYIPQLKTIIEYQGYFTHGKEPYIGSTKQKEIVKIWESKNTNHYKNALNVWMKKDPLKRKWAKEHHNYVWLEFFSLDDIKKWIENN